MNKHEKWEAEWWGDCTNTLGEELKQIEYAKRMGLHVIADSKSPFNITIPTPPYYYDKGPRILDIGGGPVSMLLRLQGPFKGTVVDPQDVPDWVKARYASKGIRYVQSRAEDLAEDTKPYDEIWIYNCLQHTVDPQRILRWAVGHSKLIRIFEWIDHPISIGHPHTLTKQMLNDELKGIGRIEENDMPNLFGHRYFGIFNGAIK